MSRVCWITGGGSGIGAELAKILSKNSYIVFISGRTKSKLSNIAKNNKSIIPVAGDVSRLKDCKKIVDTIHKKFRKIDLVILNAATYSPGSMENLNVKEIKKVVDINLMGVINCLSSVISEMKKNKGGHLMIVSSPAGYRGLPGAGIYGVTKSAVTFLAETIKLEYEKFNIKVQVVHPGFVKTPMTDKNRFKMPFLITSEKAAHRIADKINTNDFEIYFPKRLLFGMKLLKFLPNKLYFKLIRKLVQLP
jgi:short-subunit dehydrogenase